MALVVMAAGLAAASLVVLARAPRYGFLPNATVVAQSESTLNDGLRATIFRFVAGESFDRVMERLRRDNPLRIERKTEVSGRDAWVVTVPRTNGSRADLSYPPAREVTIVDGDPPAVVVKEYRSPGALEALVEWVRRPLGA